LQGCISEGDTFEQAKENITDAIKLFLEDLNADGEEIPIRSSNIFVGQVSVSNPLIY
jgi:predicted RNase H-like HicB family nuclease